MWSLRSDFSNVNLFDCSDIDDLISPDPGARTVSSLFLEQYNADDIFQFLEQYGFSHLVIIVVEKFLYFSLYSNIYFIF